MTAQTFLRFDSCPTELNCLGSHPVFRYEPFFHPSQSKQDQKNEENSKNRFESEFRRSQLPREIQKEYTLAPNWQSSKNRRIQDQSNCKDRQKIDSKRKAEQILKMLAQKPNRSFIQI
jgi:hypothetical protein